MERLDCPGELRKHERVPLFVGTSPLIIVIQKEERTGAPGAVGARVVQGSPIHVGVSFQA